MVNFNNFMEHVQQGLSNAAESLGLKEKAQNAEMSLKEKGGTEIKNTPTIESPKADGSIRSPAENCGLFGKSNDNLPPAVNRAAVANVTHKAFGSTTPKRPAMPLPRNSPSPNDGSTTPKRPAMPLPRNSPSPNDGSTTPKRPAMPLPRNSPSPNDGSITPRRPAMALPGNSPSPSPNNVNIKPLPPVPLTASKKEALPSTALKQEPVIDKSRQESPLQALNKLEERATWMDSGDKGNIYLFDTLEDANAFSAALAKINIKEEGDTPKKVSIPEEGSGNLPSIVMTADNVKALAKAREQSTDTANANEKSNAPLAAKQKEAPVLKSEKESGFQELDRLMNLSVGKKAGPKNEYTNHYFKDEGDAKTLMTELLLLGVKVQKGVEYSGEFNRHHYLQIDSENMLELNKLNRGF